MYLWRYCSHISNMGDKMHSNKDFPEKSFQTCKGYYGLGLLSATKDNCLQVSSKECHYKSMDFVRVSVIRGLMQIISRTRSISSALNFILVLTPLWFWELLVYVQTSNAQNACIINLHRRNRPSGFIHEKKNVLHTWPKGCKMKENGFGWIPGLNQTGSWGFEPLPLHSFWTILGFFFSWMNP